jgi:GlpG protein
MREIVSFEDEQKGTLFSDVLCARQIACKVSPTRGGGFAVWVMDEGDLDEARLALADFLAHPDAPEHLALAGTTERKRQAEQAAIRRTRHEVVDVRKTWRRAAPRPARVTLVLIALSVAVTLVTTLARREDLIGWLSIGTPDELGAPFSHVLHGQVWRLVTPIFVHYGLLHILFNMWWLMDLGTAIEARIGAARFTLLVLATAVVSNAAQFAITGSPFFGGMSGVLYALFGYVWVRGRFDRTMGIVMPTPTVVVLMVWLVLGFTGTLGPVANYAHLGGLVAGALFGGQAVLKNRA